jgi:hypothetical protein
VIRADRRRIETLRVTVQADNVQSGSDAAGDVAASDDSG